MPVFGTRQATLDDYEAFVDKFKPKKTTDDCYTPESVYDAIKAWAIEEYSLQCREVVRPFYPGGDYEMYDYPEGCVVIDNPPFSILTEITRNYRAWGVEFFLFAPTMTILTVPEVCHIVTDADVVYENGAKVPTSFVTNLEATAARTAISLQEAMEASQTKETATLPKYQYPDELLTASDLRKLARGGIDFKVDKGLKVGALDAQRPLGKGVFGSGLLIDRKRAELKRAELKRAELKRAELKKTQREAIVFDLSPRERAMIDMLTI